MSNKIKPALTPEEWRDAIKYGADMFHAEAGPRTWMRPEETIALANFALPDSDPRKITRGKLDYIREVARTQSAAMAHIGEDLVAQRMIEFADAIESYLPPEKV